MDHSSAGACCACSGWGCLDMFTLIYLYSPLSPSLWETARYRLKYRLKRPLNPKQTTNHLIKSPPSTSDLLYMYKGELLITLASCVHPGHPSKEFSIYQILIHNFLKNNDLYTVHIPVDQIRKNDWDKGRIFSRGDWKGRGGGGGGRASRIKVVCAQLELVMHKWRILTVFRRAA